MFGKRYSRIVIPSEALALFHAVSALSAPSGHLPLEGKAIPARGDAATSIPHS